MAPNVRRSGVSLALAGVAGGLFFWLTDPHYGRQQMAMDIVDRANDARIGTLVGVAGSVFVLIIGLFLMTRRTT